MTEDSSSSDITKDPAAPPSEAVAAVPSSPAPVVAPKEVAQAPKELSVRILQEKNLTTFEFTSVMLSAVTFVTLLATFAVFYFQLKESMRQTELFRSQATQAAADALKTQNQTQSQIELSKDSFRRDQQPYLWLTGSPTSENYQNPQTKEFQVIVNAHYKNFGKSPAIALQRYSLVEVGPNALSHIYSGKLHQAKSITPPVEDLAFSAVTPPMKVLPEMSLDFEVVLFSRFQFLDLLGHRYETDVCMAHLQTGAWSYCETHNEIKDCEKVACEP
jgi:hypothetical protein